MKRNLFTLKSVVALFPLVVFATQPAAAGLSDITKKAMDAVNQATGGSGSGGTAPTVMGLSSDEITAGLKEALRIGSEKVVGQVGQADGYLNDSAIHIPLPENLKMVHETLNKFGFGSLTADVETRINRAAEKAAPQAREVFWQSIQAMTLDDAKKILDGPDDSATQYFKRTMSSPLTERFTPIVEASLAEVGAVQAYDSMISQYKTVPFVPDVKGDLTSYSVAKALDGLFYYMAREEGEIRANPAARTTDILKKVFGGR